MDFPINLLLYSSQLSFLCNCIIITVFFFFFFFFFFHNKHFGKLPRGPSPYPIIGNILELGTKPHQSLAKLSKIYGPLMTLKLGSITTIVISSPDIAKEALQNNELIFQAVQSLTLAKHSTTTNILWPSSTHHQFYGKLFGEFASQRYFLHSNLILLRICDARKSKICWIMWMNVVAKVKLWILAKLLLRQHLIPFQAYFFPLTWLVFLPVHLKSLKTFLICGILEEVGSPNVSDFFPFLRLFDPQR